MALKKLSYIEFEGEVSEWRLAPLDFGPASLVVGKNATGKSRLINVITSLMHILCGRRHSSTGHYDAELEIEGTQYNYELSVKSGKVELERLQVANQLRLERTSPEEGSVYYQAEDRFLKFGIEPQAIAIHARQDRIQHPFIVALSEWAASSVTYAFSDFGKNALVPASVTDEIVLGQATESPVKDEPNNPVKTYVDGFTRFGEAFDRAIVEDMVSMGFPVTAVHAEPINPALFTPRPASPLIGLSVSEDGVVDHVNQIALSQGMFRALALSIKWNWTVFSGRRGLILIDDLGEGLDYERACKAIELTMQKARSSGVQVIVTSNDRFVMNAVPLENWVALRREHGVVRGYTSKNSPEAFENFRFTGLSNFDFFTAEAFH